jgi:lipid-binding SYLF domain-containing protein
MNTRATTFLAGAAGALLMALAPSAVFADDRADAQQQVNKAEATFKRFVADPDMTWFRDHLRDAKGFLIVPEQVKGGFIIGGSGGAGVLVGRGERGGSWSYPAFYNMGSASIGLQIGAQVAEVVLMIMTDRGMDAMYSTEFKLGADASVAAGPVGAGAQAATADVLAFARSKGVFGGVSLEGAVIASQDDWNTAYYGREVRTLDIVERRRVSNAGADALRRTVARAAGGGVKRRAPKATAAKADYDVAVIQQRLKELGFDPGPVDGKFGSKTERAIRDYQSARGEPMTGRPSKELQRQLESR